MKKYLLLLLLVLPAVLNGQHIWMEGGKTFSSLSYRNSDGEDLDNIYGAVRNHMSIGISSQIMPKRLSYNGGLALTAYGAEGSIDFPSVYYKWEYTTVALSGGLNYNVFQTRFSFNSLIDFSFYLLAGTTLEYVVSGTQAINSQVYNLFGTEQFNQPFVFAKGGLGVRYSLSRVFSLFLQYSGGRGWPVIVVPVDDNEKIRINAHQLGFGIIFNMPEGY